MRLRDWYLDGSDKQGAKHGHKRRTLAVTICFAPLLRCAWRPNWEALFTHLEPSTLAGWTVIVLADRGL
jgi:hypothetical protein